MSGTPNDDWLVEQQRRNQLTAGQWSRFEGHRRRVMELLLTAAASFESPRLALLGAGNCNDVDLALLVEAYRQVVLFDWDEAALLTGIEREGVDTCPTISAVGGIELTGLGGLESGVAPAELVRAAESAALPAVADRFEVVASLCLLSQLIEGAARRLPTDDPHLLPLVQAVRHRHLQIVTEMTAPGGCAILITDLVSSDTVPELTAATEAQLPPLVARSLAERNFFTGLNPAVLLDLLQNDPWFQARVSSAAPRGPWRWDLGPRSFAVFGITFRRKLET